MPKKKTKPPRVNKVIGASLTPDDLRRIGLYGDGLRSSLGLEAKPATLVTLLVRKGLDAVEAER